MAMILSFCSIHVTEAAIMIASLPIDSHVAGHGRFFCSFSSELPLAGYYPPRMGEVMLCLSGPSNEVLRLRGGKNSDKVDIGEALQVLGNFTPKKKALKVRGMPKQPRESGLKEKMKVSDQKAGSKRRVCKKKKKRKIPLTGAPWRWQSKIEDLKGDIGWYKGRQIEVRQRTEEGNHIIRVGYVGSFKSRNADREKAQAKKELQEGLWTREAAIKELQRKVSEAERTPSSSDGMLPALREKLAKLERDMLRYRDSIHGTSLWKNLTAHTVPKYLRHVSKYDPIESDTAVYTNLNKARTIVYNPSRASTASEEELLALQAFFTEQGMVPHVQKIIRRSAGLKPLLLLGTIGGGRSVFFF
jgi:hypothetical protein